MEATARMALPKTWDDPLAWRKMARLRREVVQGQSIVVLNGKGQPERIVTLVVLRIGRSDGQCLVELGARNEEIENVTCQLPGNKLAQDETSEDVITSLLEGKLAPLADHIEMLHTTEDVTFLESSKFQIMTLYRRTVVHARFRAGSEGVGHAVCTRSRHFGSRWSFNGLALSDIITWHHSNWSRERKLMKDHNPLDRTLVADDVFALTHQGNTMLLMWLTDEELTKLNQSENQRFLQCWVSTLECGSEALPSAAGVELSGSLGDSDSQSLTAESTCSVML